MSLSQKKKKTVPTCIFLDYPSKQTFPCDFADVFKLQKMVSFAQIVGSKSYVIFVAFLCSEEVVLVGAVKSTANRKPDYQNQKQ